MQIISLNKKNLWNNICKNTNIKQYYCAVMRKREWFFFLYLFTIDTKKVDLTLTYISCMDNQHKEPLQALRHFNFELGSSVPVFLLSTLVFASDWLYNYLAFQVSNKCWPKTIELPLQVRMQCWIHYLYTCIEVFFTYQTKGPF